jgi:hypothetical protein
MKWTLKISGVGLLVGLIAFYTLPGMAPASGKAKPGRKSTHAELARMVKAWAYEKKTVGVASKVKGVFKKSARTLEVKVGFQNVTSRTVRGIRGYLRFATMFNEPLYDLSLEAVLPIEPARQAGMDYKLKRENFPSDEAFKRFCDLPLDQMRQVWVPTVVVFEDGTTLQATAP